MNARVCCICGAAITEGHASMKTCSAECHRIRINAKQRAYNRMNKEKNVKRLREWERKNPERAKAAKYTAHAAFRLRHRNAAMILVAIAAWARS